MGPMGPGLNGPGPMTTNVGPNMKKNVGPNVWFRMSFFPEFSRAYISLGATTDYSAHPKNYRPAKVLVFEDLNTMIS